MVSAVFRGGSKTVSSATPNVSPRFERDEPRMNRHRALAYWLSMIFTENRFTLFRIML
jgi:hypothetical protein